MYGYKREKKLSYLKYTIVFIGVSAFFTYICIKCGRSFLYHSDATMQHIVSLAYLRQYIHEFFGNLLNGRFVLPEYDLSIGQGANIYTTLTYYGFTNPLYWLIGLFPSAYVYEGYCFLYDYAAV